MAKVRFESVTIQYPGAAAPSVSELDLEIADGEFLVLVGPSGCGKSTTLRALAGLEDISSGHIFIGDKDVTGTEPGERDIAMVFQNYALYPHLTVEQNMGFALKLAKVPKAEIAKKVAAAAETLGLTEFLKRKPKELSGGQRQRVAMGRAIVREPQAFLMDEPLSNLDAKLRVQTRSELAVLQQRLGTTTVYVTHDQVEAMTMGDRVAVLKDGLLQQVAPPRELYDHPANEFVAGFIGSPAMNIFPASTVLADDDADAADIHFGVRPEHMQVHIDPVDDTSQQPSGASNTPAIPASHATVRGTIDIVEELGAESYIYLVGNPHRFVARWHADTHPRRGQTVTLSFDPASAHRFDTETGRAVSGNSASTHNDSGHNE
ncbi:sn-glycerol-3-phosphate ABC transporter ATP-binding protein UgpC [Corynebacterium sp. MSK297]|uniref:ABC transporter ATP-binding protein n=1 Tax=Corynebacterium sp. MSK297 TaxID=3050221 RepID=UPI0025512A76|nr:sn-glycerol-3-phosphate ABC transporter ATP-binding protein UgpC [Corynebacterium sp. MSK297]MDK8846717.1 sn-glycerol-3-phosphate ABC transporter ATP-binding protein UgpC [Corynebacterium sp. MSK297]